MVIRFAAEVNSRLSKNKLAVAVRDEVRETRAVRREYGVRYLKPFL
jgi:hypothetical protein